MTHPRDPNSEEATRIEMIVQAQLGGHIRGLRVVLRDNGFILQGRTPTYYAKQMAQHAAMRATELPILANEIEVCYPSERRRISCG